MNNQMVFNNDDQELFKSYKPCSKKIFPSLFAWFLLLSSTSSYFTLVLPFYYHIIGAKYYLFSLLVSAHIFSFVCVVINFSVTAIIDPGRFPKNGNLEYDQKNKNVQNSNLFKNVLINDINVRMKWCSTCEFYRPPRSSHCGICNACIDTMDHHCPWISNCIGRRNYKFFLYFLISLTIHMVLIFCFCLIVVLLNRENLTHFSALAAIFLILLISILIIPVGGLTCFHLILVSRGRTTNEQVTGKFRTGVNPFDKGFLDNWLTILFSSMQPSFMQYKKKSSILKYQKRVLMIQNTINTNNNNNTNNINKFSNHNKMLKISSNENYKNINYNLQRNNNTHLQNELELKFNNYLNHDLFLTNDFYSRHFTNNQFVGEMMKTSNIKNKKNYKRESFMYEDRINDKNSARLKSSRNDSYLNAKQDLIQYTDSIKGKETIYRPKKDSKYTKLNMISKDYKSRSKFEKSFKNIKLDKSNDENRIFLDIDKRFINKDKESYEITV